MSEVMLFGVLRMSYELAMSNELTRRQFYDRAQEAVDMIGRLQADLSDARKSTDFWKAEYLAGNDLIEQQAARIKELEKDAAFRLAASSRETEEARFYRYLRDEAGQSPDDHDGPMICSGLGDNFDCLRGEECDKEIRAAIDAARRKR